MMFFTYWLLTKSSEVYTWEIRPTEAVCVRRPNRDGVFKHLLSGNAKNSWGSSDVSMRPVFTTLLASPVPMVSLEE